MCYMAAYFLPEAKIEATYELTLTSSLYHGLSSRLASMCLEIHQVLGLTPTHVGGKCARTQTIIYSINSNLCTGKKKQRKAI